MVGATVAGPLRGELPRFDAKSYDETPVAPPSAAQPFSPMPAKLSGNRVARWEFDRADDRNYDDWPDHWKRRHGREYPAYLPIGLSPHHAELKMALRQLDAAVLPIWQRLRRDLARMPAWLPFVSPLLTQAAPAVRRQLPSLPPSAADSFVDQYLRVELDGGAAMLQSEPIQVSRMYGYTLSVAMRCQDLHWDHGWVEIVYLDDEGQPLQTVETQPVEETQHWQHYRTEATGPPEGCRSLVVRLRVEPKHEREDIRGWVGFDQVELNRYPQLQLDSDAPNGLYLADQAAVVSATALGLSDRNSTLHFVLQDVDGKELQQKNTPVSMESDPIHPGVFAGSAEWKLPNLPAGYYRVIAYLRSSDQTSLEADATLAVIETFPEASTPFGWTMPEGAGPIALNDLPGLLSDCHVGWMKYPCWTAPNDLKAADKIAWLMAHLQERGINAVGLIDQPPIGVDEDLDKRATLPIATVLRDEGVWLPLLEPLMSRLTLKVRRWQLGRERDFSFLSDVTLSSNISKIRAGLQGYGPPLQLAVSWPWLEQPPPTKDRSWSTVVRSETIPLTAAALDHYLAQDETQDDAIGARDRWLLLDPLPKSQYRLEDRVRDLVFRMATVRGHEVSAAFVRDPFDSETGLVREDGSPGEMLLPWRTTSAVIGSLRRIGSLQLPGGSPNIVFSDGQRSVMAVWNETPKTETLYLGEQVEMIDVWGKRSPVETVTSKDRMRQQIEVGTLPTFVVGLDPIVAQFRMGVRLADKSIDSLLGREQAIHVLAHNQTGVPLSGDVQMEIQDAWDVSPIPTPWQLKPGQTEQVTLGVTLRTNATTGPMQLQLNYSLHSGSGNRFSVYRDLHVGPEGLEVHVTTRLDQQGNLIVRLEMVNKDVTSVRYDCRLFPAGRQYQRRFVQIGGGDTERREFILADGAELLGTPLLLRASEEGGRRVLNYTVPVTR